MERSKPKIKTTGLVRSKAYINLRDPSVDNKESPDPVTSEDDDDSPIIWQMSVHGGPIPFFSQPVESKPTKPTLLDKIRNIFKK